MRYSILQYSTLLSGNTPHEEGMLEVLLHEWGLPRTIGLIALVEDGIVVARMG